MLQPTISNEQTAQLPMLTFKGEVVIVESDEQMQSAYNELASCKIIGFDTETRPSFKAGVTHKVALLQISTEKKCYLFRLCRNQLPELMIKILEDKDIIKVGADILNDIRTLKVHKHFKEAGFVDLQKIIDQWGVLEKSLRKMSAIVMGKRISKAQRLSNWEAQTLTPQQIQYAATDAWACVEIYNKLISIKKNDI